MSKLATILCFIVFIFFIFHIRTCQGRDLRDVDCDCRCDENGDVIGGTECENLINNEENEEEGKGSELSSDLAVAEVGDGDEEVLKRDKRYYGGCGCCGCCMMGTPKTVTKTIKVTYGGCCGCGGYG
uniref:Uncharacterized protein n=1 Tax=Strongyloides papillosus TaxID=174720 RepID=A0A0N5B2F3_STREA